jgi:predicted Zn-dependent peptidase
MTILVAGDTRLDVLLPLLDAVFGDWTAAGAPRLDKHLAEVQSPIAPRVFLAHRPDALQSHISAVNVAPPTSSPGYTAMRLANTVLGGTFTSRLNMNLREDKRWSYGARSNLGDAIGQRLLTVSAPVQTDKTAESMREMLHEMQAIASDRPPSQDEIDKVKMQGLRMLPGSYESNVAVLQTLCTNKLYGRSDDYALALGQRLEALTMGHVGTAAKALFSPEAFTWLIEGDLAKIEAPVRSLGLGEVSVLDVAEEM